MIDTRIASTRKLHTLMRWPGRWRILPTRGRLSTAPTARPARTDLLTGRRRPSIALWRRRIKLPRRIIVRLRVAPHIHIGVHPLLIAFFAIGGEEDTDGGFVIARVVVVQAAEGVGVLAGEAFARCHAGEAARVVAQVAVGAVGLVAAEGGAACCGTEGGDHAAEWVGQQDVGRRRTQARQFPDQTTVEAVVIRVVLQGAVGAVAVFFQAKGVDGDGRSATADGAAQRARAAGVVGVVFKEPLSLLWKPHLLFFHLAHLFSSSNPCISPAISIDAARLINHARRNLQISNQLLQCMLVLLLILPAREILHDVLAKLRT